MSYRSRGTSRIPERGSFLWDQNWCDFFSEQSWHVFHVFFIFFVYIVVLLFSPQMVGQFFFGGDVCWEGVLFVPFGWSKHHGVFFVKRGDASHPLPQNPHHFQRIWFVYTKWRGGSSAANEAMKPPRWMMIDVWCMMCIYIYTPSCELRKSQKKWLLINEFPFSKMGYVSSLDGMYILYINFTRVHMSPFLFWTLELRSDGAPQITLKVLGVWEAYSLGTYGWSRKEYYSLFVNKFFYCHSCKFEGFVSENVLFLFFLSSSMRTFQPTEISEWRDDWLKRGFPEKMSAHCRWTTTTCHQATIGATNSKWACGVLWRSY